MRSFLVQAPGQRGKALGFEDFADRRWTQRDFALFEHLADLVNGVVLLTQRDDEVTSRRLFGLRTRSGARSDKEARMGIADEAVTEDAEGAWGITKGFGGFGGRAPLDVIGAKRLVLALLGMFGLEEEVTGIC